MRKFRYTPLAALLRRLREQYDSQTDFAEAFGADPSRLSRAMNGDPVMFDVFRCLCLARATRENASEVLRAAGKSEIADLIEELYGAPKTADELALLHAFKRVSPEVQQSVLNVVRDIYQPPLPDVRPHTTLTATPSVDTRPKRRRRLAS